MNGTQPLLTIAIIAGTPVAQTSIEARAQVRVSEPKQHQADRSAVDVGRITGSGASRAALSLGGPMCVSSPVASDVDG